MNNELKPIYLSCTFDARKSFYNKCFYIKENNLIKLFSYNTYVLGFNTDTQQFIEINFYPNSQTTKRHIKEFRLQIENKLIA